MDIPLLNSLSLGSSLSMGDKVPHTHTHAHARTHTHTHARARAHTHTNTHTHIPGNKTAVQCVVLCIVPDNKLEEKRFWIEWLKPFD